MKYLFYLLLFFTIGSLCAQIKSIDTTKIKTMKLVKNKQEFKEHFKDSNSYLILQPSTAFPQTDVWISPPKNFKAVENIRGFIHLATTTSITCTEIKGYHYSQLSDQLTSEYIANQNAVLNSTEDIVTDNGMTGKLLIISFIIPAKDSLHKDIPFERLMLFTGNLETTVWINATYPQSVKHFIQIVRKSLLSVKLNNSNKQ